jgi:hypothetical protein
MRRYLLGEVLDDMAKTKGKAGLCLMVCAGAGVVAILARKALPERLIEARVRRELERRWGREAAERILVSFRAEHEETCKDGRMAKGVMGFHLTAARQGLALYRALARELGEGEDAVDATHQVIWDAFLKAPSVFLGYLMSRSKDPFAVFARGMDWVNARVFPTTGWERAKVEVEGGIGFDYTGCFYNDYMREMGAPELTPIFCEMDVRQAECFPPQIAFERTRTLSVGDALCDFRFYHR